MKYLYLGANDTSIEGAAFAGSSIETVVVTDLWNASAGSFSGTSNLKNVWISAGSSLTLNANLFTDLETDVNFYFYDMTYEQVVAKAGNDNWFKNADERAHFYFKDTIPAGTEIPEDVQNNMK